MVKQDVFENNLHVMCHIFQRNVHSDVWKMFHGLYKRQVNPILEIHLW
jgi:hypothetical protein